MIDRFHPTDYKQHILVSTITDLRSARVTVKALKSPEEIILDRILWGASLNEWAKELRIDINPLRPSIGGVGFLIGTTFLIHKGWVRWQNQVPSRLTILRGEGKGWPIQSS